MQVCTICTNCTDHNTLKRVVKRGGVFSKDGA